jgi:hypothetical protein
VACRRAGHPTSTADNSGVADDWAEVSFSLRHGRRLTAPIGDRGMLGNLRSEVGATRLELVTSAV